jgi:hypothetical protein
MNDRVAQLLLEACAEAGALQAFVLLYELRALADGKEFTTSEACEHARAPENGRLRAAMSAVCNGIDGRKLARFLSDWRGKRTGFPYVVSSIGGDQGWLMWKFAPVDPIPERTRDANDGTLVALTTQGCDQ